MGVDRSRIYDSWLAASFVRGSCGTGPMAVQSVHHMLAFFLRPQQHLSALWPFPTFSLEAALITYLEMGAAGGIGIWDWSLWRERMTKSKLQDIWGTESYWVKMEGLSKVQGWEGIRPIITVFLGRNICISKQANEHIFQNYDRIHSDLVFFLI